MSSFVGVRLVGNFEHGKLFEKCVGKSCQSAEVEIGGVECERGIHLAVFLPLLLIRELLQERFVFMQELGIGEGEL